MEFWESAVVLQVLHYHILLPNIRWLLRQIILWPRNWSVQSIYNTFTLEQRCSYRSWGNHISYYDAKTLLDDWFTIASIRFRQQRSVTYSFMANFATKAMHIELVTDLSTNGFISALQRFVSRRGTPTDWPPQW